MIRITILTFVLILTGCDGLIPERDKDLETKVAKILPNSEIQALKIMDISSTITITGKEIFELDSSKRDEIALEIGNIAISEYKTVETVLLTLIEGGNGALIASYTWQNVDGKLVPIESAP